MFDRLESRSFAILRNFSQARRHYFPFTFQTKIDRRRVPQSQTVFYPANVSTGLSSRISTRPNSISLDTWASLIIHERCAAISLSVHLGSIASRPNCASGSSLFSIVLFRCEKGSDKRPEHAEPQFFGFRQLISLVWFCEEIRPARAETSDQRAPPSAPQRQRHRLNRREDQADST
jgi:hypothetical protein